MRGWKPHHLAAAAVCVVMVVASDGAKALEEGGYPDWFSAYDGLCTAKTPGSLCNPEVSVYDMKGLTPTEVQGVLASGELPCCDERSGLDCSMPAYSVKNPAGPYCDRSASMIQNGWYAYDLVTYAEPADGSVNGRPVWKDSSTPGPSFTALLDAEYVEKSSGKVQLSQGGWRATVTDSARCAAFAARARHADCSSGMAVLNWHVPDRAAPKLEDTLPYGQGSLGIPTNRQAQAQGASREYTINSAIDLYCQSAPTEFILSGQGGGGTARDSDVNAACSGTLAQPTSPTWDVTPDQSRVGHLREVVAYAVALGAALNKLPFARAKFGLFSGGWRHRTDIDVLRRLAGQRKPLYMSHFLSASLDEVHAAEFTHYMYQPGYPDSPDAAHVPVMFSIDSRHGKELRFWNQWEQEFIFLPNTPFAVQSVLECVNKPHTVDDPWIRQAKARYDGLPLRGRPGKRGGWNANSFPSMYYNITLVDIDRSHTEADVFPTEGMCLADSPHRFQPPQSPHPAATKAPELSHTYNKRARVEAGAEAEAEPKKVFHKAGYEGGGEDVRALSFTDHGDVRACTEKMLSRSEAIDARFSFKEGACPPPWVVPCWHPALPDEVKLLKAEDELVCDGMPGAMKYQLLKQCDDGGWPCRVEAGSGLFDGFFKWASWEQDVAQLESDVKALA